MKKNKSPCIDACDFSSPKGWCLGCARTRKECQQWKAITPYRLKILQKDLEKRLVQLKVDATK